MDPITLSLIIAGGIQVVSTVIGELANSGKQEEADQLLNAAAAEFNMSPPEVEAFREQTLGPSAVESIQTDPQYREAQQNALASLRQVQASGGLTLEDRAAQNDIQREIAQQEQATRGRILQSMRERGMSGSGAELAAQLSANQGAADRASRAGTSTAAQAQRRYFDSILAQGRMASDFRGQDYGEALNAARARDRISEYNAAARERGQQYRASQAQQQFGNNLALADRRSRVKSDRARIKTGQGQDQRQFWNQLGQAGAYGASSVGSYMNGAQGAPGAMEPPVSPDMPIGDRDEESWYWYGR
jgi:hypothetical protein